LAFTAIWLNRNGVAGTGESTIAAQKNHEKLLFVLLAPLNVGVQSKQTKLSFLQYLHTNKETKVYIFQIIQHTIKVRKFDD